MATGEGAKLYKYVEKGKNLKAPEWLTSYSKQLGRWSAYNAFSLQAGRFHDRWVVIVLDLEKT